MKKIALIFALIIFTAVNIDAAGFTFNLKKCERYGTQVLVTFSLENGTGADRNIKIEKKDIMVLDAEGNKYETSGFYNGALCNGDKGNRDEFVFGSPTIYAPTGSNGMNYSSVTVPDGVDMLVRLVVYDVPTALKSFDCIQVRCKLWANGDEFDPTGCSLNWNQANYSRLAITTVKE